jgi:hypothetical protein
VCSVSHGETYTKDVTRHQLMHAQPHPCIACRTAMIIIRKHEGVLNAAKKVESVYQQHINPNNKGEIIELVNALPSVSLSRSMWLGHHGRAFPAASLGRACSRFKETSQ